jgi:hypothetical protein
MYLHMWTEFMMATKIRFQFKNNQLCKVASKYKCTYVHMYLLTYLHTYQYKEQSGSKYVKNA